MGLIAAGLNASGGTRASPWKEYFYADALPNNVLAAKAQKKVKGRFGGSRHEDDITLPVEERPIGGLGIFLVKNIMDEVTYRRIDGRNELTMLKRI